MVLPVAEQELELLGRFLQGLTLVSAPLDADLEDAQAVAQELQARLTAPVRVAVAGLGRSGKTSLIHLLLGEELLTVDPRNYRMPPVELRHGTTELTRAGWWDRKDVTIDGLALSTALSQKPDVISLILDHHLLRDVRLIDVSDFESDATVPEGLFALTQLADMVIWCVDARTGWTAQDRTIWDRVPRVLQRRSVLALTHTENMAEPELLRQHQAVIDAVGAGFAAVLPVASTLAWQAVEGTAEDPEAIWISSGADDLFNAAMTIAADLRQTENTKILRLIENKILPLLPRVPVAQAPIPKVLTAATPLVQADARPQPMAVQDLPPASPPPTISKPTASASAWTHSKNSVLEIWLSAIAQINGDVQAGRFSSDSDFVQACQLAVAAFLPKLDGVPSLQAGADWLIADFEQAQDLLVLMQYESGDATAHTAARLLVQLSEALSGAVTPDASVVAA